MRKLLYIVFMICNSFSVTAQSLYFPPAGTGEWETLSPVSLGWHTEKIDSLYDYLEDINSKAFILLKDGKIVLEKYFGTFTADSSWYWASAGKTLTGFLIGLAQEDGYLSIDDQTSAYLGEGWTSCTPEQESRITVRHQLTMTTGLDDGVEDHYCTLSSCLVYLADPGTRWAYHNGPYTLLDGVMENASGKSMNLYVNQKLTAITGLTGLFIKSGYNNVFFSKARSMARFGLLLLNKGTWENTVVMGDTSYLREMTSSSQDLNKAYGYLTWLNGRESFMVPGLQYVFDGAFNPDAPSDMYCAMGKNGQFLDVVPSRNLVMVRMGNAPDASEVPFLYNDSIWIRLNEIIVDNAQDAVRESSGIPVRITDLGGGHLLVKLPADGLFTISAYDTGGRVLCSSCGREELLLKVPVGQGLIFIRVNGEVEGSVFKLIPKK